MLCRLLKKPASIVLASLRGSTYGTKYDSPPRSLRPCWTSFLKNLLAHELIEPMTQVGKTPLA
jgi:hypothetical protein